LKKVQERRQVAGMGIDSEGLGVVLAGRLVLALEIKTMADQQQGRGRFGDVGAGR